ncbi:MAG: twin-arginine translocase TatA/TatE family subunit [Planctomycetota bacterium]|nr:MAG: twin-arginine translocase TatA/TatE family subunit [Planctomycetota bacterium]
MFPSLSPMEMMVIGGLAVMLFGKRLPEIGRSLGRSVVEFKKGMRGVEDELSHIRNEFRDPPSSSYNDSISSYNNSGYGTSGYDAGYSSGDVYDRADVSVPKFEPPGSSSQTKPKETFESSTEGLGAD